MVPGSCIVLRPFCAYSIIAGRAIKSEYLAISTLLTTGGLTALAMSGGKKQVETPKTNETTVGLAKEQGKIGSRCVASAFNIWDQCWVLMPCSTVARRKSCEFRDIVVV